MLSFAPFELRHSSFVTRPFYPVKCPFLFYFTGALLVILHSKTSFNFSANVEIENGF